MRHTFSLVCAGLLALTLLAGCEKTTAPKTVRAPLSVETLTVEAADQPRWITPVSYTHLTLPTTERV